MDIFSQKFLVAYQGQVWWKYFFFFCLRKCQAGLGSRAIGFYVLNIVMIHAVIIIMDVRVLTD